MSLIQDVQRNAITDQFMHIDFLEVSADHAITAHIPVHTHGTPVGVSSEGGVLDVQLHEVEVRCLPKNLPHQIDVDVTELKIGDLIHLKNLPAMEGVEIIGDEETTVVSVAHPIVEEEPEETSEEEKEVEIISEKKDDEEGGEEKKG